MRAEGCNRYRELLGAYVLGRLEEDERRELERHISECPRCRAEVSELRSVTELLPLARVPEASDEEPGPPPDLEEQVVAEAESRRWRERSWSRALTAAAVLLLVVVGALIVFGTREPGQPGLGEVEPVAFSVTREDVSADAAVVAHTWGTEVLLEVEGLEAGEVYTVSIERMDGAPVPTGTFIGVRDATVDCQLNGAVLRQDARAVVVMSADGDVVLRSDLEQHSPEA